MPPHDGHALSDQLRALLTQQGYDSVVIHNYMPVRGELS
jgi:hypothetical protein